MAWAEADEAITKIAIGVRKTIMNLIKCFIFFHKKTLVDLMRASFRNSPNLSSQIFRKWNELSVSMMPCVMRLKNNSAFFSARNAVI